ncbi:hypothetical protein GCM10020369_67050 [Cryptosporangium minutisporangium]|uniref:Lipoprotein n=1 Tax=Cryptosporangium minutisporangium TaxID=113569 RepID=A0ABP6T9S5_9ACTN
MVGAGCFGAGYFTGKESGESAAADTKPRGVAPSTTTLGSPSAASEQPDGVAGVWKGTYTCSQGATGLTLTIEGEDEALAATFEFYPTSENPSVKKGSYKMGGNVTNGRMVLIGTTWIDQPDGYQMVNISSTSITATTITGTIDTAPGCTSFRVTRS